MRQKTKTIELMKHQKYLNEKPKKDNILDKSLNKQKQNKISLDEPVCLFLVKKRQNKTFLRQMLSIIKTRAI